MDPQWLFLDEERVLQESKQNKPLPQSKLKTFSRQNYQDFKVKELQPDSENGLDDKNAGNDVDGKKSSGKKAGDRSEQVEAKQQLGRYPRKVPGPAHKQEAARMKSFMADMRAHFAEVDAFELATASPEVQDARRSRIEAMPGAGEADSADDSITPTYTEPQDAPMPKEDETIRVDHTTQSSPLPSHHMQNEAQAPSENVPDSDEPSAGSNQGHNLDVDPATTHPVLGGSSHKRTPSSSTRQRASGRISTYGLSRRSSVCFADRRQTGDLTGLSRQKAPRQSLVPQPLAERGRKSSLIQPGRSSAATRFSLGLPKALHRLSIAGILPTASQPDAPADIAGTARRTSNQPDTPTHNLPQLLEPRKTSVWHPAEFSPIAEGSPLENSPVDVQTREQDTAKGTAGDPAASTAHTTIETDRQSLTCNKLDSRSSQTDLPVNSSVSAHAPAQSDRLAVDGATQATPRLSQGDTSSQSLEATLEAELEDDLQDLCGAINGLEIVQDQASREKELTPLQQLLQICNQSTEVAELPTMEELICQHVDLRKVKKIGEGTFGEAFKGGNVVLKIVPMDGSTLVNGEVQKVNHEIFAEVSVALTLNQLRNPSDSSTDNLTHGFVETFGVGICKGTYAAPLVAEWHRWDDQFQSENDPVDCFPGDQLYVVFVVANGGVDLEHFDVRSFAEARSLLLQCAMTLAVGEEACEFEHRDLHWGNVLLRNQAPQDLQVKLRGVNLKIQTSGLAVTLIDFTLSRLVTVSGDTAFCDLSADEALFEGPKGDCQAETYRRMRKATSADWQKFVPATNAVWIHYLADLLLSQKQFPATTDQKRQLRNFRRRALASRSCADLVTDEFFSGLWKTVKAI